VLVHGRVEVSASSHKIWRVALANGVDVDAV